MTLFGREINIKFDIVTILTILIVAPFAFVAIMYAILFIIFAGTSITAP